MWYNIKIILNGNEGNERCKYLWTMQLLKHVKQLLIYEIESNNNRLI